MHTRTPDDVMADVDRLRELRDELLELVGELREIAQRDTSVYAGVARAYVIPALEGAAGDSGGNPYDANLAAWADEVETSIEPIVPDSHGLEKAPDLPDELFA